MCKKCWCRRVITSKCMRLESSGKGGDNELAGLRLIH